jgi:hypothetical protein
LLCTNGQTNPPYKTCEYTKDFASDRIDERNWKDASFNEGSSGRVESLKTKYQTQSEHPFWFRKDKLGDWVYESGSSGIHEWVNRPKQFSDDALHNWYNPGMW